MTKKVLILLALFLLSVSINVVQYNENQKIITVVKIVNNTIANYDNDKAYQDGVLNAMEYNLGAVHAKYGIPAEEDDLYYLAGYSYVMTNDKKYFTYLWTRGASELKTDALT